MSIKIENVDVHGFEASIRGMRSPMNSWDKSDSVFDYADCGSCLHSLEDTSCQLYDCTVLGENDLALMKNLSKAGTDHSKYLRFITVTADITAPLYWWKEFKTYRAGRRFGDDEPDIIDDGYLEFDIETNSCSTMHKIHAKEFTLDDFSHEHLTDWSHDGELCRDWLGDLEDLIEDLNFARELYLETKNKQYWWQMIQLLPSSYNQKRTVLLNYQVLKNMYHARKSHKLDEWLDFCRWCKSLPYFREICVEV